jgi:hypothetical protein
MELEESVRDLLRYINDSPRLLSLLYDIDMMPEQLERGTNRWLNMLMIAYAFRDHEETLHLSEKGTKSSDATGASSPNPAPPVPQEQEEWTAHPKADPDYWSLLIAPNHSVCVPAYVAPVIRDAHNASIQRLSGKKEAVGREKDLEETGDVRANTAPGQMELLQKTKIGDSGSIKDPDPHTEAGWTNWIENGVWYKAPTVDSEKFGRHDYGNGTGSCKCGCYAGGYSSSGPVDPWGACPLNPKKASSVPEQPKSNSGSEFCQCEDQVQCRNLFQYRCVHCGKPFAPKPPDLAVGRDALSLQRALGRLIEAVGVYREKLPPDLHLRDEYQDLSDAHEAAEEIYLSSHLQDAREARQERSNARRWQLTEGFMNTLTERLDEIEERANKAMPGPWRSSRGFTSHECAKVFGAQIGDIATLRPRLTPGGKFLHNRDADFIASARTDVPALVKALRRAMDCIDHNCGIAVATLLRAEITAILSENEEAQE